MGVLAFAAWGHYFVTSKPITQPIIMLAMSLAYDRGLTKPVPIDPVTVTLYFNSQGCPKPVFAGHSVVRTMEERRTVIGLFFISSVFVEYNQVLAHTTNMLISQQICKLFRSDRAPYLDTISGRMLTTARGTDGNRHRLHIDPTRSNTASLQQSSNHSMENHISPSIILRQIICLGSRITNTRYYPEPGAKW